MAEIDELEALFKLEKVAITKRVVVENNPGKDYLKIATKLGTKFQVSLSREALEECLKKHSLGIYPLTSVAGYMDAKVDELNKNSRGRRIFWGWFPLRGVDVDLKFRRFKNTLYAKRVPIEALQTVEKVVDELGGPVRAVVADVYRTEAPRPDADPFLAITGKGLPLYVVERWNEPKFRS